MLERNSWISLRSAESFALFIKYADNGIKSLSINMVRVFKLLEFIKLIDSGD